jgi:hypothetical protein
LLEKLEDEEDLNQKLSFNNHLMYHRICQLANSKLESIQAAYRNRMPDEEIPMTKRQMREMHAEYIALGAVEN